MIKLIATDVDGTLVKESSSTIYPEIYDEIIRLTDSGIKFCIASGRQFDSVKKLFAPVEDRLSFIANNGAHIRADGKDINVQAMDQAMVNEIIEDVRSYGGLYLALVTPAGSFTDVADIAFQDLLYKSYKNDGKYVEDLAPYTKNTMKISVYSKSNALKAGSEYFIPKWSEKCRCCMAGDVWIDFMTDGVDKGNAMKLLMNHYNIRPDESMTFGDNENDIGMIQSVKYGYAVENAKDIVKASASYICPSYLDKGVLGVLQNLNIQTN